MNFGIRCSKPLLGNIPNIDTFLLGCVRNDVFDYCGANPYLQDPKLWFLNLPVCDWVLVCEGHQGREGYGDNSGKSYSVNNKLISHGK